jgi:hypothetical protein
MDSNRPYRPRVSRETRLLLTTALVAVVALWVLARVRFPDLPATPNPVSPLLSQLATTPTFDGLASEVSQLRGRLEPWLIALDASSLAPSVAAGPTASRVTALRIHDDLGIILMPTTRAREPGRADRLVATDRASGLSVVRVSTESPVPAPTPWQPRRLDRPQVFMVTDAESERTGLRPVFVASLEPIASALWSDSIWTFSQRSGVLPGSFVFTTTGEFAGMVIEHAGRLAVVPSAILFAEFERLVAKPITPAGDLGIRVQSLTADVSAATGATVGVVVTWVNGEGPSSGVVRVGDVIEAADGSPLPTPEHWRVRLARLGANEALRLRIRRRGGLVDVQLQPPAPAPASPAPRNPSLGLRMRGMAGSGTEVLSVEEGSAAIRAGLAAGDVITLIGDVSSPTPAQVRTAFSTAPEGTRVLVGLTRGATHLVTTLTR